ncbi:MAG: hypothetical protein GQ557_01085 [Mycoplasmataceae bacterium]|nr:hypothetical protein [Mycoplasmataceae bacterium]
MNLLVFFISSLVYGYVFYNFRRSTIFENSILSGMKKSTLYLAIFLTMFLYTFTFFLLILLSYIFLIAIDSSILMNAWFFVANVDVEYELSLSSASWSLFFYWFFAAMILNFSLFYLFQNISSSQRGFYLFSFLYLFLLLFYGGTINSQSWHFSPPIPYSQSNLIFLSKQEYKYYSFIQGNIILEVGNTIKSQWEAGKYFAVFMKLITPHYWLNNFFSSSMLSSYLNKNIFTDVLSYDHQKQILLFINNNPSYDFLSSYNTQFSWYGNQNNYWSFENDISWLLSLYLWTVYFVIYSWLGYFISSIKAELN